MCGWRPVRGGPGRCLEEPSVGYRRRTSRQEHQFCRRLGAHEHDPVVPDDPGIGQTYPDKATLVVR